MDNSNLRNLNSIASEDQKQKIMLMSSFANNQKTEVPDPYYGGEEGFYHVIDLLEDFIGNFIEKNR